MNSDEILFMLLVLFLGFVYLSVGAFFAWILGITSGTFVWVAVAICWPIISVLALFLMIIVAGLISNVISAIRG